MPSSTAANAQSRAATTGAEAIGPVAGGTQSGPHGDTGIQPDAGAGGCAPGEPEPR
ncbi:hypothetical protein ACU61A_19285 [Pseudonocardia sichuanensis]|uniref:hypothetical protein n=1 Tax=Pseudonocardia kunmingensis TaxID=630975 RepID=UPI001FEB0657|nr:hypothetical protein [Pseudonocardia kunmingensis]